MNTDYPDRDRRRSMQDKLQHSLESARQLMQPAAFRIAAPEASDHGVGLTASADGPKIVSEDQFGGLANSLAIIATAVWRVKTKLASAGDVSLPDELRNLPRHIQAAWDALDAGRIQVDDPIGRRYVPGMAVNILTIQPIAGNTCETILETIKPSIYFNDTLIQRADVIVARPMDAVAESLINNDAQDTANTVNTDPLDEKGTTPNDTNNH